MRTRLLGALCALLVPMTLAGCDDRTGGEMWEARLRVTVQDWTGWQRQQPAPTTTTEQVTPGMGFTVPVIGRSLRITATEVDGDHVELETSEPMSPVEDGTTCLADGCTSTRFEVGSGGTLEIGTPSLDGGTHITIEALDLLGLE